MTAANQQDVQSRAAKTLSSEPRPFLRWAGSKRALLSRFVDVLPHDFGRYWEPFLGAGSLFFLLEPKDAVLNDSCGPLIETYIAVRYRVDLVLRYLAPLHVDKETYYDIRRHPGESPFRRAAEFIYLNKAGWNGLYRVNSKGQFNVPYGAPKSDVVVDRSNLRACSSALAQPGVALGSADFEVAIANAEAGDLVFLDPPYVTGHNNNGFIDYNEVLFSWTDQLRLAAVAIKLANKGVNVVVTNAHHQPVIDLYKGFQVRRINRASTLAGAAARRGRVDEALFWKTRNGSGL